MTLIPESAPREHVPAERRWRLGAQPWRAVPFPGAPRARVIVDNDFSGDPDDLFQLVHHLLSPGVEIRAVIGSHLREGDPFDAGPRTAGNAVRVLHDVFSRLGLASTEVIHEGANAPLADRRTPQRSPAADAIVAEALRDDDRPLYYVAGGGLTDLASAWLLEPRIAERMTVIWIGGREHDGLAVPPPDAMPVEYNLLIDVVAGQVVFTDSDLVLWQVPRDVYRQCIVSDAELRLRVASTGPVGAYLYDEVAAVNARTAGEGRGPGETYVLGDSPLVLLTALQSLFEADPASSRHVSMPTPALDGHGRYEERPQARPMRVYTFVDTRLLFEDLFLKLAEFGRWQQGAGPRAGASDPASL
ncbi:nucleoside hydrolase [Microbacterium betulae]|uniref:Nucleoside hydrolase n=1 Tax=Microbacterium betulae TaxID=2981139 RepID=A0AA97I4S0_9MICO|nr:nucleoside hydrolase [Microbacterium sp. AB]WOF22891.1 nucleoside hydrolase [Microbacterium sp. AB]